MLELVPTESDDAAFLSLIQLIVNGALAALGVREVFLVHVDNWFDYKWLGWWSWTGKELSVPPFNPNRVRSEKHFIWDGDGSRWASVAHGKSLHLRQPGRSSFAQPLDRWSKSAAFLWYSGNTVTNRTGSLMLYLSGAERYSWYASFTKDEHWRVHDGRGITTRELRSFVESGRQVEPVQVL